MPKISLTERIYNWIETLIMDLVPQKDVSPLFKWIFKLPILQYKLGLGWVIGRYILLLTTTGRKSGKPRHTPLEYEYDSEGDRTAWLPAGAATRIGTAICLRTHT